MKIHKLISKADDDIFAEIIKGCEGKMVSPFKKEVVIKAEDEDEPEMDSKLEDLSEEDLEKLKELYSQIKND